MFLARLPDGSRKEAQVYEVPREVPVVVDGENAERGIAYRYNTPRAWRYDSTALKPGVALRSSGYAAIARTAEQAIWRAGALKADEEFRANLRSLD